jgi:hypothetical protein
VRDTRKVLVKAIAATIVVAALAWLFVTTLRDSNRGPYDVPAAALTGWTVAPGEPGEPGIVALVPPPELLGTLFRQVFQRTMSSLAAPPRPAVPLVLRSEFADSLQGAVTVEQIVSIARDAQVEASRFAPVCMGHRIESSPAGSRQLFYAMFDAPVFAEIRRRLLAVRAEHAGTVLFDPANLRPILTVATSDRNVAGWWPMTPAQQSDCEAPLRES